MDSRLEAKRTAKALGKATEADVVIHVPAEPPILREVAEKYEVQLPDFFLCATVRVEPGETLRAEVAKSQYPGCERCWRALEEVSGTPALCRRCTRAVRGEPG